MSGCKRVQCCQATLRTRGALRPGKRDRWYRRVNAQPQNPAYSGFLHKASILPWQNQPPLLILHPDAYPSSASHPIVLSLNVLPACPFMLWHNVAFNGWPPLGQLDILLTVPPVCVHVWCNMGVISGSTGGGDRVAGHCTFSFTTPSVLFGWVTHQKKRLCTLFSLSKVWPIWKQPWSEEDKRTHMWHAKAIWDLGQGGEPVLKSWHFLVNASNRPQPLAAHQTL